MTDLIKEQYTFPAPKGRGFSALREEDVEVLAEGVLAVLEGVGIACENRGVLSAAAAQGAKVDQEGNCAKFPRQVVLDFLQETRREPPAPSAAGGLIAPAVPGLLHQLAVYTHDWERGERRAGNKADFITLTKLANVLHPEHGAGHSLLLSDVPAPVEPLEAALLLFQYADKPAGTVVAEARQIPYLQEIEAIAGITDPRWHWITNVSFATPLRLSFEAGELFAHLVRSGDYPAKVYNFGVSGASMPVTVGGAIVVAAAEILALWMLARGLRHDVAISGNTLVQIGTADMRTGNVSWWAFDGMIRSMAACQFLRQWTGIAVSPGGGEYTPSSCPGSYVALEKAYRAMVVAAFTGHHPHVGSGHLEAGLTFSPVQLMLDRDMSAALRHLEVPSIDSDSIGIKSILEVGHGLAHNYLESEHTLRYFRQSLWMPEFLSRAGWEGAVAEERVLRRAQERVNRMLEQYRQPQCDPAILARMRQVVEKARKALA